MALSVSSLPPDFSWLRPAYRPSDQEVDAYAHVIADVEGCPPETSAETLYREAELQLWIWRTETGQRASRGRRRSADIGFVGNMKRPADFTRSQS